MKRTLFVVSDIHGHYTLLKNALDKAGFDKEDPNHLLVCCGDYFDRGSENVAVLKFFERLKHCVLLRGNHEDMLLKLLYTGKVLPHHYINGTMQTMTDFFGKFRFSVHSLYISPGRSPEKRKHISCPSVLSCPKPADPQ